MCNAEPVVSEVAGMDTAADESMPGVDVARALEGLGDSIPRVETVVQEAGDGGRSAAIEADGLGELTLVPHAIRASLTEDQKGGM